MNPNPASLRRALGAVLLCLLSPAAFAMEGGLGRPISGATIMPYAGVVPPESGLALSVGETYYAGSIGGSVPVPVGQQLTLGIDLKASFTPVTFVYIWDTAPGAWSFASGLSLPVAWLDAEADVTLGPTTGRQHDSITGLFDLIFVPLVASHHLSKTEHLALTLTVWAPTGRYDKDKLANLGTNTWTFIPSVSYTKLLPERGLELSGTWALTFDTENSATNYQNGILSDLEVVLVKRAKDGPGFGLVASWIEQLTDDEGDTADTLHGFKGRAFGVGPILTWSAHLGKQHLEFNARWVHEFENKNYVQGDLFMLNGTLQF